MIFQHNHIESEPTFFYKHEIHNSISQYLHLRTILPILCVCCLTESKLIAKYCKLRIYITCHTECQILVTMNKYL